MTQLKKDITFPVLLFLAVNAIIGTGIFFLPGMAAFIAGPASLLSWTGVAILAVLISMCFAELSSLFPKSGGVYEYAKNAFGDFIGFMTGWITWIIANVAIAMLVTGGMIYLDSIFHFGTAWAFVFAVVFVIAMNIIGYRGINFSTKVLFGFAIITISILVFIIVAGSFTFDISRLSPFFVFSNVSIFVAMYFIMETFFGWESISFLSEEVKDPKKTMPRAFIISTLIIVLLVLAVVFVSLTAIDWRTLASSSSPLVEAVSGVLPQKVLAVVAFFVVLNILGSAATWIVSAPRLIFAMSREKDLPVFLSRIHEKYKTPYYAIIFQMIITLFVLTIGSFRMLLEVLLPLTVIMYSVVVLSVTQLRKTMPKEKRSFSVPFPKVIPPLIVVALWLILLMGVSVKGIALGMSLVLLGLPLYLIAILGYHEKVIKFFNNLIGGVGYKSFNLTVGNYVLEHLYNFLSDVTISRVADIGCGVGIATHQIAKRVIPLDGMAYGVDFAKRELAIAERHRQKRDVNNLEFMYADLYNLGQNKEIDRKLRNLDAVVGVGILEYLPDPVVILSSMKKRLRPGGKFYFIDYDYLGHIFDKPWLESDESIRKVFAAAGFKVKIWRQKRLFWQYVHMYGEKN